MRCALMPNARPSATARLSAFPSEDSVTATEVMVTVTAMLKAVNLQVFELGMWQTWAGSYALSFVQARPINEGADGN